MTASGPAVGTTWPLHNGKPPHAAVAPRFAVRAPNNTVVNVRPTRTAEAVVTVHAPPPPPPPRPVRGAGRGMGGARWEITLTRGSPVPTLTPPRQTVRARSPTAGPA